MKDVAPKCRQLKLSVLRFNPQERESVPRMQAYEVVQRLAMAAWQGRTPFKDLVEKDPFVSKHLSAEAISTCFNPKAYIHHVPAIFKRVFGNSGKPRTRKRRRMA